MMSKDEVYITEKEYQDLLKANASGLVFFPSLKGTVNLNSTETILPEDKVPKKELTKGRLHDGTDVVKQFGTWKSVYSPEAVLDAGYYPEIARDCVWSEEEYQAVKDLPTAEKARLILEKGAQENYKLDGPNYNVE